MTKKFPSFSWVHHQALPQKWIFFTPPPIYNDKLLVVFKDNNGNAYDSIDVMKDFWIRKCNKFNYSKESVWDHIIFRQFVHCREAIRNKSFVGFSNTDSLQNVKYFASTKQPINHQFLHNIDVFVREMLNEINYKPKTNSLYQVKLITNYTQPFYKHTKAHAQGDDLVFATHWKKY